MGKWENDNPPDDTDQTDPENRLMTIVQTRESDPHAVGAEYDVTAEEINALRELFPNLTLGELRNFGRVVKRTGLDPFARQIFPIKRRQKVPGTRDRYEEKLTIQTGIEGYRAIAERTGTYRGQTPYQYCGDDAKWIDAWPWRDAPTGVRVGVLREGREPLFSDAYIHEFAQLDRDGNLSGLWRTMPRVLLGKCAEAQALRRAFPNVYRGVYTTEEMLQADPPTLTVVQPQEARQEAPRALPAAPVGVVQLPQQRPPVEQTVLDMQLGKLKACRSEAELTSWYQAFKTMNYGRTLELTVSGAFVDRCRRMNVPPGRVTSTWTGEVRS